MLRPGIHLALALLPAVHLVSALPASAARWVALGPTGGSVVALAAGGGTLAALSTNAGLFVSRNGGDLWQPTGPGPQGSQQVSALHVSSDGTVYVTDGDGELWRSRDAGATWTSLRAASVLAGAPPRLTDLDSDSAHPEQIVAVFDGGPPFRSHDRGDSWETLAGFPADARPIALRFDPKSSARLLANSSRGIWWSDDAGARWQQSTVHAAASSLALEPGFRGRVYALVWNGDIRLPRSTVYVSLDHGRTFLSRAVVFAGNRLVVDPTTGGALYATDFLGQVWRSTTSGRSFRLQARLTSTPLISFAVDAGGTAYAAVAAGSYGRSILRSRDRGATWTAKVAGLRAADVLALAPSADGERWWTGLGSVAGTIWSASHFGIWALDGNDWRWKGLRKTSVRDLSPHPVLAAEVVAATLGAGIARTIDGGVHWSMATPTGIFVTAVDRDPTEPRHVLAVADRGVAVSRDGGASWSALGNVETGARLRFARDGSAFYANLAPGEFFSENDVDALARFAADGQSKTNLLTLSGRIQAILEPADAGQGLWVASTRYDGHAFSGEVHRSTDGGLHWQRRVLPGGAPALALASDRGPHAAMLVGSAGAVYSSTDGGQSWSMLGEGLPTGTWVSALALGTDGRWRAATVGAGVFVLTDEP